ncbi:MAG: hypothetical protein AB2556_25885 [Candidatus Thiodiazotropha sp.]
MQQHEANARKELAAASVAMLQQRQLPSELRQYVEDLQKACAEAKQAQADAIREANKAHQELLVLEEVEKAQGCVHCCRATAAIGKKRSGKK